MRIEIAAAVFGGLVLWSAGPSAPAVSAQVKGKTMAVWVTAAQVTDVTKVDKDTEKKLEATIKSATKTRRDLEKTLKAQHGNKRESWPQEAQDSLYDAEEAEALAVADYAYRRVKQAGLADSAEDIKKSIAGEGLAGKKDTVTLAQSKEDAQLIIEVSGRRSASSGAQPPALAFRDDQYFINFLVKPGPKLSAESFARAPRTYRFKRFGQSVWRLAAPKPESPEWRFEAFGNQRWGNAANTVSLLIEDFIVKNADAMLAP